jgi:hypothetical protein
VQNTATFIEGEVPSFVEELIRYRMWATGVELFISAILLVTAIVLGVKFWKIEKEIVAEHGDRYQNDEEIAYSRLAFGAFVIAVISAAVILFDIGPFIQVLVAPRSYILEYVKGFF